MRPNPFTTSSSIHDINGLILYKSESVVFLDPVLVQRLPAQITVTGRPVYTGKNIFGWQTHDRFTLEYSVMRSNMHVLRIIRTSISRRLSWKIYHGIYTYLSRKDCLYLPRCPLLTKNWKTVDQSFRFRCREDVFYEMRNNAVIIKNS